MHNGESLSNHTMLLREHLSSKRLETVSSALGIIINFSSLLRGNRQNIGDHRAFAPSPERKDVTTNIDMEDIWVYLLTWINCKDICGRVYAS